jgi:hypothetical protein
MSAAKQSPRGFDGTSVRRATVRDGLRALFGIAVAAAIGVCAVTAGSAEETPAVAPAPAVKQANTDLHAVPPPPFSEGVFPCSGCHAGMKTNPERRELVEFHDEIKMNHGPRDRWCFDCHNPDDRDQLRLVSGRLVPFTRSYELCGQCHGDKLRDWNAGIHGKRTGEWDGKKQYLLCAHCHNPHAPAFAPIQPMPAPPRPEEIR